jgi:hypothetical protein
MNTIFTPKFYLELNSNPALQDLFNRFNMEVIPSPEITKAAARQEQVKKIIERLKTAPKRKN